MTNRESKFQKEVIDYLRSKGIYVYKNAQNMYTEKGRPDLCACIPTQMSVLYDLFPNERVGIFAGLELKREGHLNEVSPAQTIVGRQIQRAGGIWRAVDNLETIKGLLKLYGVE